MAAGTGNLQYHLPAAAWPKVYLSTLYREDVEHCERLFPAARVFQYDYLNDDVGGLFDGGRDATGQTLFEYGQRLTWKLPQRLRDDLANPDIRWVILINPPYYPRAPRTAAERAFFAGENFEYFEKLFEQLGRYATSATQVWMILSEDCDWGKIGASALRRGFEMRAVFERKKWGERLFVLAIFAP